MGNGQWADFGLRGRGPMTATATRKRAQAAPEGLTRWEFDLLMDPRTIGDKRASTYKRDRMLLELLAGTGMRINEALSLNRDRVDLQDGSIWIPAANSKSGRARRIYFGQSLAEKLRAARSRRALSHVVHVNGTRGKSTVTRLIDAGLRAGGLRVLSKTTGTDPMTIGVDNVERAVRRIGPPNIREQLNILNLAAREKADVLVVECMAVDPALQRASQEKMLLADIGVITNVRRDHEDAMGNAPEEICDALSNTIPRGGVLLSAERDLAARLRDNCALRGCRFVQALPRGDEPDFEFAENLSLALAVCEELGVARETALDGMRRFRPDPYALSAYRWGEGIFDLPLNDREEFTPLPAR